MKSTASQTRLFERYELLETGGWQAEIGNDEIADVSFHGIRVLRANLQKEKPNE